MAGYHNLWIRVCVNLDKLSILGSKIQSMIQKTADFQERNVDLILKNCSEAKVDPIMQHKSSREKIKYSLITLRKLLADHWSSVKGTSGEDNLPKIVRRRFIKSAELRQKEAIFALIIAGITGLGIIANKKFTSIKKTFVNGIYYTPSTNTVDFQLFTKNGTKWVNDVKPQDFSILTEITGNNKVSRKFKVDQSPKFQGYETLIYPDSGAWEGKEIFDAWIENS